MGANRPVSPRRLTALISALIFFDMVTWLAAIPLIPVWRNEFGLTDGQAGLVLGAYSLSVLVFAIPAGWVADRIGARRLTLIAAVCFVVAAPAIAFADTFALLLIVRIVQGACSAVVWSAGLAWLSGSVNSDYRPRALTIANACATIATIGGPLLGGPIVSRFGIGPSFLGLGVLVGLIVLWALFEPGGDAGVVPHADRHGPFVSLRHAMRPGLLQVSFLSIGFIALMMAALQLLAPLHFANEGVSSATIGWIFTAGSVLSVIAILTVARLGSRLNHLLALVVLPIVCGVCLVVLLFPIGVPAYAVMLILLIGLAAPIFAIAYPICATGARAAKIGEGGAFGMLNAIWAVGSLIAPVLAGIATQRGASWLVYVLVVLLSVIVALALLRSRAAVARA
jgi:MFS transporter, ACDE family, multidrug resistance protein